MKHKQTNIIYHVNFVDFDPLMLHAKFQDHRPFGTREDYFRFLPYVDLVAILVMSPGPFIQLCFPLHKEATDEIWL